MYEGVKSVPPPNHHCLGAPGASAVGYYNRWALKITFPTKKDTYSMHKISPASKDLYECDIFAEGFGDDHVKLGLPH